MSMVFLLTLFLISCTNVHLKNQGFNWENNERQLQSIEAYTMTGAVSLKSKEDNFFPGLECFFFKDLEKPIHGFSIFIWK